MIAKFILLVVFANGPGSRANYNSLGEFFDLPSCLKAGNAIVKSGKEVEPYSHIPPSVICVAKGEKL